MFRIQPAADRNTTILHSDFYFATLSVVKQRRHTLPGIILVLAGSQSRKVNFTFEIAFSFVYFIFFSNHTK